MDTKQRSISVSKAIEDAIQEMADKEKRSFSSMAGILLEQAVKERERQRAKRQKEKEK